MKFLQAIAAACITLGIACLFLAIPVSTAQPPVAQERLDLTTDPNWALLEFENGSQWYMRMNSIHAFWGVPPADWKKLGFKTRIFGSGFTVNCPYTIQEVEERMIKAKSSALIQRIKEEEEHEK